MKSINHIISLSLSSLLSLPMLLSSCTDSVDKGFNTDGESISFVTNTPGVSSRTTYDLSQQLLLDGFTVSAFNTDSAVAYGSILPLHFEDQTVSRELDGVFRSVHCRWPANPGSKKHGHLKIYAFHPSRAEMKKRAGVGDEYFVYSNRTRKYDSDITYDYRLTNFRVAPDIYEQVDFVTAIGEGNKTANLYSGVKVDFEHQLSGVVVGVWGASKLYDVEIAGVRIGGIITEADFNLTTELANVPEGENTIGSWIVSNDTTKRGHVDFVFAPGDKVVMINANEHNTKDKVSSIMGSGGKALLIPQTQGKWDYKNDRDNTGNGKGMYFSALIRMYEREGDHHLIYPSTDPQSRDCLVYLAVRTSDGMVMKRLSSEEFDTYVAPEGQEKRAYGWAAAPGNIEWKPGFLYSYVLDYTEGVGVHDPADGNPAATTIDYDGVGITTATGHWGNGEVIKIGGDKDNKDNTWGANNNNTAPDGTVWWK